jgi:GDPmannose 4,6-dehydratase
MKIVNGVKKLVSGTDPHFILTLGNIDSKRDWGHSKDYVYGMWLMLQQTSPDDYVLATGETYSVRDFIERSFLRVGKTIRWEGSGIQETAVDVDTGKIVVKIDEKYFRPCEVDFLLGNPAKAVDKLGWSRLFTLDDLIDDMMKM